MEPHATSASQVALPQAKEPDMHPDMDPDMHAALEAKLDGLLIRPDDGGYDRARSVWNAMIDRRPQVIVRCGSVADVATAVRYARDHGMEIGVRCGGHNITGYAVPDGGLMIDLTPLNRVRVDPARRRAWIQGGALLGSLDRATQAYGLATTAGNVSHTGVGGLTLGGGMGWLARQYGLACDNVVSYELITADGELLRASATEHPDLYWGLRGGGGNFGIVTQFEFRLHQVGTRALAVSLEFGVDDAVQVLRGWRDISLHAPRQATFEASVDAERALVGYVWVGDPEHGMRLLDQLRDLGKSVATNVEELSYLELQTSDDAAQEHAFRRYWKGHYFKQLDDDAISAMVAPTTDDLRPAFSLQSYGGAITDVPDGESAFGHRDTAFEFVAAARWSDPAEDAARMGSARAFAAGLDSFASGAYVNALTDEGAAGVRRAYPAAKLTRLVALKDIYDPDNTFHLNHNIAPSQQRESVSVGIGRSNTSSTFATECD
jgi:FAD/FMN-containing dehydrogenase